MVPVLMQTPPTTSRRSAMATFFPSLAACTAARWPAGPVPMTRRSRSSIGALYYAPQRCAAPGQGKAAAGSPAPALRAGGRGLGDLRVAAALLAVSPRVVGAGAPAVLGAH